MKGVLEFMKPIKPKYKDTVKVGWKISRRSKQIISQYAKYTKYDEDEIIDNLIKDIIEDKDFVEWLKSRRFQKKILDVILEGTDLGIADEGVDGFEEVQEDS